MSASYRPLLLAALGGVLATAWCAAACAQRQGRADGASLCCTVLLESPQSRRVALTLALDGIDPGRKSLRWTMQRRFAFVRLPEPLLEGPVRATAGGAPLAVEHVGPYEWSVATAGCASVQLKYVVPLTHRALEAVKQRDAYEYPYLADDHGLLVTPTLFMFPEDVPVGEIRVRFDLPEGWPVVAPWRRVGDRGFAPDGRQALLNDLIAVGAWRLHEIRVGRFEGTIAVAPGQDELEKVAVELIRRIVEYELKLFGREPEGRYLFLFGRPETSGLAGSPKTHSMTLSVEPRLVPTAAKRLPHLIAHEFFHTWAAGIEMPDELRWVNEGFTDYYAYLVAARLKLDTWEEFAGRLAEKMQNCAGNPLHGKLSLAEAGGDVFFGDRHAYDLVYDGGLLIAAWLDRTIRRQSRGKTLDDAMRAFKNDPRWTKDAAAPTLKDFFAVVQQFTDEMTAEVLERFVTAPYDFDPLSAFAQVGIAIRPEVRPARLDLRANLDGTRVIDLDRSGVAYRIGIREDDRLIEINGQAVTRPGGVHAAWRQPVDGRIRVKLDRRGEQIEIDQPVPDVGTFIVPVEPWREHQ